MDLAMRGTLKILPTGIDVNYNSTENTLSLKEVVDSFCVNMDTKEEHAMLVHYSKDKAYCFKKCGKVLYYLNIYNPE